MAGEGLGNPVETKAGQDLDKARRFLSIHRGTAGSLEIFSRLGAFRSSERASDGVLELHSRKYHPSEALSLNRKPFVSSGLSE